MIATMIGSAPRRLAAVKPMMMGRKKNIESAIALRMMFVSESFTSQPTWTSRPSRPLRMPDPARTPTTGIIDPVMTPISELNPYFTQPRGVVGFSTGSAAASSSPAAP